MQLCFLTRETDVCQLLIHNLSEKGYECYLQEDWIALYKSLQQYKCPIDLIVCDFTLAGSCYFNLFDAVKKMGQKVPVIYYNDPVPADSKRVSHWLAQNESFYEKDFSSQILPALNDINNLLLDPSIRCHISLLQPAVPVGYKNLQPPLKKRVLDLYQFRKRNKLSPVMYRLFEFMYKNQRKELSMKELAKAISCRHFLFKKKGSSVYSYISRLRRQIQNDCAIKVEIIRSSKGCYEMIVY